MTDRNPSKNPEAELPGEPIDRLLAPVTQFLRIEAAGAGILLLATLVALVLANSPWAEAYAKIWSTPVGIRIGPKSIAYSLEHLINDGLMTLFFFVVGLEIKRELIHGELRKLRVAMFPIAAALGGMVVPAVLFLALQLGEPGERGWGVVMATDIAFVVGCLAVLGTRVPHALRIFVLSLAIIDDIGAILIIALAYSQDINTVMLGLGSLGIIAILGIRYLGVRSVAVYFFLGFLAWVSVDRSGIHPTILGVVLGLLTPARPWVGRRRFQNILFRASAYLRGDTGNVTGSGSDSDEANTLFRSFAIAAREARSPLERLETALHPWVNFLVLPLFAMANAGVPITFAGFNSPLVLAVIAGLVLGKPIGILGASWLSVRMGMTECPDDVSWPAVAAAGVLCGIGFTMAIFIANLAFEGELLALARFGILFASLLSALLGLALLSLCLRTR